jgi:hypothetical protein
MLLMALAARADDRLHALPGEFPAADLEFFENKVRPVRHRYARLLIRESTV